MKKRIAIILTLILAITAIFGMTSCSDKKETKKEEVTVNIKEEVEGFWYDENSNMLFCLVEGEYLFHGFGTGVELGGTYTVAGNKITLTDDNGKDLVFTSVQIKNDVLSYTAEATGKNQKWERVSEDEVRELMEIYD